MENSQTTTPHTTSSVAVPQPSTLEGHHHNILVEDHHRGSSGGRTFLKSTTAATSSSSPSSNPSSNINNNSGSNNNNNNTNSSSSVTTPSTRRTRHRVDAGEPRGCFNNYYSPRNIFQNSSPISSSNSHSNNNNNNNIPGSIQANSNNLSNSLVVGNSITGAADYYFQPMKMLSDFIGNSHSHFNNHNSTTAASQLLLREMLQKKKIGYEDDVSEIREREREIQSSEESIGCSSGVTNNNNNNNNLTNNNDEIKINGCKNKRKLYQPQKSEFDDDQEEYKDLDDDIDMEYKNNHSADEDDEIMLKSPMAPLTRQLLTCERKQIPRSILQSWKENFKSTLMTHINELVDSQFNVLFGSIGNNSLPHSQNNSQPPHHPQPQHNSQTQQQQQQQQQLQHLHHHHHSNPHPPTSRQQSITPPPSTGSAGSVPTGSQDMMGASTKTHLFNGGGSILLSENEKLRMRFQSGYRPQTGYSQALAGLAANNNRDVYEDDGPLSLVVTPKKKRHKVTDTRLTPRAVSRLLGNGSSASDHYLESTPSPRPQMPSPPVAVPISLPTSVAIPNPSLTESRHLFAPYAPLFGPVRSSLDSPPTMLPHHAMMNPVDYVQQLREISAAQQQAQREHQREQAQQATIMKRERGGGSPGSPDSGDTTGESFDLLPGVVYGPGHSSSTLTPMHLRKAKLMFFWVRYPSSAVLKMYFPDIKFNKNNTAQLVKWFSNFREFYYIQMEKYARQALSEGIKIAEDIHVSTDNELYRVLNLHYNRNNHIEVPTNFRFVVEQTLREFFKAIQSGKDSEQSWKKAIYKIIARLDDPVPEYFKSPNFLEQLE